MNIPFQYMPQTFHSTCCLKLTCSIPILGLVTYSMIVKFLTVIVSSPKISIHLSSFSHIIPNHLSTSHFISIFHHKCPHILSSSLIKPKNPNFIFNPTFSMVSKFGLIYFNSPPKMAQLVFSIMILEIQMDQIPDLPVYIIDIEILKCRYIEFF